MIYYLDTNILVFLITEQKDEICPDVQEIFSDYGGKLLASTVCVHELMHLYQLNKLPFKRKAKAPVLAEVLGWLDEMGIEIVPVTRHHLEKFAVLPLYDDHRDPNDRLIIAQAITDRVALISSDHKFSRYRKDGLDFIFNER